MESELTQQISSLSPGDHLCLFYEDDPAEQMSALIPFIRDGLARDEQFIYIADDQAVAQLENRLRESGIDVREESERGTLKLWTRRQWRQPGPHCPEKQSQQILQLIDEAAKLGFKGSRFAVEMTWTLGPNIRPRQLEQWEAALNNIFVPGFPGQIVCQYNCTRFSPETMLAALRTHHLTVLGDDVYPNWFYQAPLTLSAKRDSNLPKTDWMISILKRSRAAHKELQVAQRRLQEAQVLAAIGTAATKIVHDMTNPLNAISTTIQLQERYLENKSDRLPDLVAGTVQDLKDETNRVRELIDELRHFSQPLQLKLDPTDLAKLAEEVAHEALFKPTGSASIQFEQHCAGDLPLIMADGEKLRRVVLNLFNNALQAMPDGGTLTFKCYREGNHVCLEIQDTGCGIPKEMKIFEPFTTSKANGWGLGLTIAQQIILAHKGFIRFSSEPGQGTTFTILLPVTTTPT